MRNKMTEYETQHVLDLNIGSNLASTAAPVTHSSVSSTHSQGVYNEAFNESTSPRSNTSTGSAKQHGAKLTTIFSDG